jgi:hypothetical protein
VFHGAGIWLSVSLAGLIFAWKGLPSAAFRKPALHCSIHSATIRASDGVVQVEPA